MRKLYLSIIACFYLIIGVKSQTPYYDAIFIRDSLMLNGKFKRDSNSIRTLAGVLRNYCPPKIRDDANLRSGAIISFFIVDEDNRFFKLIDSNIVNSVQGLSPFAKTISSLFGKLGKVGGLDVTTFADGAAKFLVERAKEEFNVAFFQKLKKLSEQYPEFKILFPRTQIFLTSFEAWDYSNILMTLREAFDKDLKNLLLNILRLPDLKTDDCSKAGNQKGYCEARIKALQEFFNSDKGRITLSVFHLANGFLNETKVPDIIHNVSGKNLLGGVSFDPNVANAIQLVDLLSYSVRSTQPGKSYISPDDFFSLMSDATTRNLYFGLLYEQIKSGTIKINGIDIAGLIRQNYEPFKNYVENLVAKGEEILSAYNLLKEARKQGELLDNYWAEIFTNANEFLSDVSNFETISASISVSSALQDVITSSNRLLEIAHDISVRNYNAAVLGALTFLTEKFPENDGLDNFKIFFNKYGSFAANVVHADNSDEVKLAIRAVALPSGSASIKKNTHFNIALNSYLGWFYGTEYLANKSSQKTQNISGVTAPIGVNFSWQLNLPFKQGSFSIFIPFIDIGAFASFRLQDSTTADLPKVTLQNIFSPGVGVVYGIPKVPLSIGYMWQYGPALREISATKATVSENINNRNVLFLAVDIPLINFYNKTKTISVKKK